MKNPAVATRAIPLACILALLLATAAGATSPITLFPTGEYRATIVDTVHPSNQVRIGWMIPPGWAVDQPGPTIQGTGSLKNLFKKGEWAVGDSVDFHSGWSRAGQYCYTFGLFAEHSASGDFDGGAFVTTLHGPIYDHLLYSVTDEGGDSWLIELDFWTDGRLDDLAVRLERLGPCDP